MGRWNRQTLLAACEAVLQRDDVRLVRGKATTDNVTAHFDADVREDGAICNIVITVDPDQGGLIECVLHELLHIVLDQTINASFNSTLEERMIKALEQELFVKTINKGHLRRWRKLVNEKLEG